MPDLERADPPKTASNDPHTTTIIWVVLAFFFFLVGWCVFHSRLRRSGKQAVSDEHDNHSGPSPTLKTPEAAHVSASMDLLPDYEVVAKMRVDREIV